MQIPIDGKEGDSLENPIVIDSPNAITGLTLEHEYIDSVLATLDSDVRSIDQNLIFEHGRQYDRITVTMIDGSGVELYFDVSSFFGKM